MALYSLAGLKLAETVTAPPALGVLSLAFPAPVNVTAGQGYYLGVWTNSNGTLFGARTGNFVGAGVALNFEAVNVAGVAGLPASVAGSLGNKTGQSVFALGI